MGIIIRFITSPPTDEKNRVRYDRWLAEHLPDKTEDIQYPYLLSVSEPNGVEDEQEKELLEMRADVYAESVAYTDDPEELVFLLGRPDYSQGCERARAKFIRWLRKYREEHGLGFCDLTSAIRMESGSNPICLGRIIVRKTDDRRSLIQELEPFGPVRLSFIDIRNPWVD